VRRLLVTASVVPSSPILVTLMQVALSSSKTSVLTRATRRNIPEYTILHTHRRENLKSYKTLAYCHQESVVSTHTLLHKSRHLRLLKRGLHCIVLGYVICALVRISGVEVKLGSCA
jgi:hypothetical protein